jgi:hypothetical protein
MEHPVVSDRIGVLDTATITKRQIKINQNLAAALPGKGSRRETGQGLIGHRLS